MNVRKPLCLVVRLSEYIGEEERDILGTLFKVLAPVLPSCLLAEGFGSGGVSKSSCFFTGPLPSDEFIEKSPITADLVGRERVIGRRVKSA
jgi:hypothetical protein